MKRSIGLSILAVMVVALGPAAAQPANYIIVPGVSVGDIQLGWSQRQVLNRLGMPDEISNDRGPESTQNVYWVYPQEERRVLVVSWTRRQTEAGGVDFIFTDASKYTTSRGIAMQNATFKEVLDKYGAPERVQGGGRGSVMLYYETLGVRFRVEGDPAKVTAITVVPKK